MSDSDQIVYSVLTLGDDGWHERGKAADMHTALRSADQLFASRKFRGVKVDKHFFDTGNNRFVTATILDKSPRPAGGRAVYWLLLLALLGGVGSFVVTYLAVNHLS